MNTGDDFLSYRLTSSQSVPHRQIGLGANVTLETITVPTEVILWRMIPKNTRSKCLNVTAREFRAYITHVLGLSFRGPCCLIEICRR
jgi:hypothetical protein